MNIAGLAVALAIVCGLGTEPQQRPATSNRADLAAIRAAVHTKLEALHARASFPGMTAGFVLPDGRSCATAVGLADPSKKTPMAAGDRMLAGSIGKTYVSAVTLRLVHDGKLDLDTKISRWLGNEAWFTRLPNGPDITLRMLMNHSSGIPEHVLDPAFIKQLRAQPDRVWTPPELVAFILNRPRLFPAGEGWSYADTNFILVGMIVERVTGQTLYDEIRRTLLEPLHLAQTSPSTSRVLGGLISGHVRKAGPFGIDGPTLIDGKLIINPQCEWAGGGFVSNSEDLARWASMLYGGGVLNRAMLDRLFSAVPARTGKGDKYGLGVQVRQSPWGLSVGHGGWFPGYLSEIEYFQGPRLAVAVQFNTDDLRALGHVPRFYVAEVARTILAQIPDYPDVERSDQPRLFAEGVISTEDDEVGGVFNPDQTEFYFAKLAPYTAFPRLGVLCVSRRSEGRWSAPEVLPFSGRYLDFPPRLSPDGKTMVFGSSRPLIGSKARVLRIWKVAREGGKWGEPEALPAPVNDETSWNWGASLAADGTLYFASTRDPSGRPKIFRARLTDGKYAKPDKLGPEINSDYSESDPFISADGKLLFFVSTGDFASATRQRPGTHLTGGFPYPRGEIFVSRQEGGKWTTARALGHTVNTAGEESIPSLSPDGKFLLFTSERSPFVVPTAARMDIDRLESALHSVENGHGNVYFIRINEHMLEDPS
jgi:D-alanyl-D-alanine carboxypeptidase